MPHMCMLMLLRQLPEKDMHGYTARLGMHVIRKSPRFGTTLETQHADRGCLTD